MQHPDHARCSLTHRCPLCCLQADDDDAPQERQPGAASPLVRAEYAWLSTAKQGAHDTAQLTEST